MKVSLLLLLVLNLSGLEAIAQRVVRKGVQPVQQQKPTAAGYGIGQLNGKWQEVTRMDRSTNKAVAFTDTLLLNFKGANAEVRDGGSMSMYVKGQALIEGTNNLVVAGDSYTIRALSKNQVVLDDGEFIRTLHKVSRFHYETLGEMEVKQEVFKEPVAPDAARLKGKWMVYKRQAEPGFTNEQARLIKSLEIRGDSANYLVGNISYFQGTVTETRPMVMTIEGNVIQVIAAPNKWDMFVYKADGKELVFGKAGELLYFAKP